MGTYIENLERLSALKQSGALSEEEFNEQKRKLLSDPPNDDALFRRGDVRLPSFSKPRLRWLVVAISIALTLFAGWWWFSPYWALHGMQSALEDRDADAFAEYIDFPRLRSDLKSDAFAKIAQEANSGDETAAGFAVLGASMAGPMIDGLVSPEGLRALFAMKSPDGRDFGIMSASSDDVEISRSGLTRFEVSTSDNTKLIFGLSGFSWKLVGVEEPSTRSVASNSSGQTDLALDDDADRVGNTGPDSSMPSESLQSWVVGVWSDECNSGGGLFFNDNGRYGEENQAGTWVVRGNSLEITINEQFEWGGESTFLDEPIKQNVSVEMIDENNGFFRYSGSENFRVARCSNGNTDWLE